MQRRCVLDTYPALDLERSRYETFEGTKHISSIKKTVLRKIPDDAPPIFHVAEYPLLVLVNADLHRRLVAATKHPGVLQPAEEYRIEY